MFFIFFYRKASGINNLNSINGEKKPGKVFSSEYSEKATNFGTKREDMFYYVV